MSIAVINPRAVARADKEFLPAALEILETPPAPLQTWLILFICTFILTALAWSYFSRIDIIAVAQGKIQPTGRVKVVQPLEAGRVTSLRVANGTAVKAGDVLILLDAGEATVERNAAAAEHDALLGEIARRRIAVALGRRRLASMGMPQASLTPRETAVLEGDLAQLGANVGSLEAQRRQKEAERDRLRATIGAERSLISTLEERVAMRQTLVDMHVGSKSNLLDSVEVLKTQATTLATQLGQERESLASIDVLGGEIDRTFKTFVADNAQKLAEAERRADDSMQRLEKANVRLAHLTLRAPIDGTVQALAISTVGQVVSGGEEVMRIIPRNAGLEIECYLANKDVGFVKAGQPAVAKLEAFPFTRYGMLDASVLRVAEDAIPAPDVQQIEGDPARGARQTGFAGQERTQNLLFPVTLRPAQTTMRIDGRDVPLTPGMAVSVEVRTGTRRVLEYMFAPLFEVSSRAMKER